MNDRLISNGKMSFLRRIKRKFCERVRFKLFVAIDRCMEADERQKLIDATEEAIGKARQFERIEEQKETIFDAVSDQKSYTESIEEELGQVYALYNNLIQQNRELANAIQMIIRLHDHQDWVGLAELIRLLKGIEELE